MTFDLKKARACAAFVEPKEAFLEALAEIERLRAENADLSKAVIDIQEERGLALAEFRAYHAAWEEGAARIQELENALVDARGKLFHQFGDAELDPPGEDDCRIVREMLQAEGKIGPDASKPRSWQITDERPAGVCMTLDLENAWDALDEAISPSGQKKVASELNGALAEIERLRASLTDLHAEYINTLEKNPECSAWDLDEQSIEDQRRLRRNAAHAISIVEPPIYLQADQQATKILELEAISRRRNEIINKQVAKIKELKADLEQSERVIDQQAARIGELEAQLTITNVALENATRKPNVVYITGTGEIGADATKTIDQTPNSAENMQKTGPDSPKMAVWQITEERKAAVEHLIAVGCGYGGTCGAISILRTMLTEAGQ